MACFSPLRAYKGDPREDGKMSLVWKRSSSPSGVELDLPCGQCIGCRLERSRQWATRCMHEASRYERNCFLTLTYSPEFVPSDGSLNLSHFQNFMKRLRKRFGSGIRFFHCGEYGENLGRPHYHALIFNHDFDDKKLWSESNGIRTYTSESLGELWPFGFSMIGAVTFESAAYVARYVMKKVTGARSSEHYQGRIPEYITMSRRPGIGKAWFDEFCGDVFPSDQVVVRGRISRPPRFYDNLLDKVDPVMLKSVKSMRKSFSPVVNAKDPEHDSVRLHVKAQVKLAQLMSLKRNLEGS